MLRPARAALVAQAGMAAAPRENLRAQLLAGGQLVCLRFAKEILVARSTAAGPSRPLLPRRGAEATRVAVENRPARAQRKCHPQPAARTGSKLLQKPRRQSPSPAGGRGGTIHEAADPS